jgi:hypothetical protein
MSALTSAIHGYTAAPLSFRAAPTTGPRVSYGGELPTAPITEILPL